MHPPQPKRANDLASQADEAEADEVGTGRSRKQELVEAEADEAEADEAAAGKVEEWSTPDSVRAHERTHTPKRTRVLSAALCYESQAQAETANEHALQSTRPRTATTNTGGLYVGRIGSWGQTWRGVH